VKSLQKEGERVLGLLFRSAIPAELAIPPEADQPQAEASASRNPEERGISALWGRRTMRTFPELNDAAQDWELLLFCQPV
jgi:hypothetical protein